MRVTKSASSKKACRFVRAVLHLPSAPSRISTEKLFGGAGEGPLCSTWQRRGAGVKSGAEADSTGGSRRGVSWDLEPTRGEETGNGSSLGILFAVRWGPSGHRTRDNQDLLGVTGFGGHWEGLLGLARNKLSPQGARS